MSLWIQRLLLAGYLSTTIAYADVVTFEDLTTFTGVSGNTGGQPGGNFFNGDSGVGTNTNGFSSGGASFGNSFNTSFGGFWSGFSYSNVVNTVTPGFVNQYAAFPGGGSDGAGGVNPGENYAVSFAGSNQFINLPTDAVLESVDLANTTYTALSIRDGDAFAKAFGGVSGDDPDFYRVTLTGYDQANATGTAVGDVTVDLADFTFADNTQDFILPDWLTVNLAPLSSATSIGFSVASSDVGPFGINTPTFFALDNLTFSIVPEPSMVGICVIVCGCLVCRRRRQTAPA